MREKTRTVIEKALVLAADTDQAYTMIPSDGAEVVIDKLMSSHTQSKDCAICAMWDYGEAGETLVEVANRGIKHLVGTGDGVKKLALLFSNNESVDSVPMDGIMIISEYEDV